MYFSALDAVFIYFAPTALFFVILAAAVRLRREIEPCCPACDSRDWRDASGTMACRGCGWSTSPRVSLGPESRTA
jgi:hypothetical protein